MCIIYYFIIYILQTFIPVCIINPFTLSIFLQIIIVLFLPFLSQMVWLKLLVYLNT